MLLGIHILLSSLLQDSGDEEASEAGEEEEDSIPKDTTERIDKKTLHSHS